MATILVVDDDAHIRELMCLFLNNEGFETIQTENGAEAMSVMESASIDLVVLDIMMPIMDGWQLCSELRRSYPDIPLLMVTAKGETGQKVKGFNLGTDDYLVKPFDPVELVVRVKALLKRYRIALSQTIQIGDVILNRQTHKVIRGSEVSSLPPKEFELLFKLASYPGQIFTREQLIVDIWGMDYEGDDRTVDVHIKRLRERFAGEAAPQPFRIETVYGLGYRLEVTA
ncbi:MULTISPECIES: response regulator transcription factor [unclassified Paenibacillus]|uniref:response regulator transcription factor n=1 Tax=unclassified Paenibacillus TaxID=185978 RepID=UPI001C107E29|nr:MULTISPECIES: response regulator transcription factor [unclassified Paenibacillus]MBU5440967.1 response regulator transcription factor [Paenibacillus sp. MSJ-34]CAH0118033.1 Heme response regulator HssR [Paenibacillus sp. CECT 9249]